MLVAHQIFKINIHFFEKYLRLRKIAVNLFSVRNPAIQILPQKGHALNLMFALFLRFALRGKMAKRSVAMIDGCHLYVHANISINTIGYEFVYLICLNLLDSSKTARRRVDQLKETTLGRADVCQKSNLGKCE